MPELPEVEIMGRNLRSWALGSTLQAVELLDPRLLVGASSLQQLVGREVQAVERRAKYLLVSLGDARLVLHFRMTGKVVLVGADPHRFVRARLVFSGGRTVAFKDHRCLGELHLLPAAELPAWLASKKLGPEPWPEPRDGTWWAERFARARGPIKPALLDQGRVAGLGNIGGSEICWHARVDPRTPSPALTIPHWQAIGDGTRRWIEDTLAAETSPEIQLLGEAGSNPENPFRVYAREGEPCPRCAGSIERLRQAGRSTFWCPACQGEPR